MLSILILLLRYLYTIAIVSQAILLFFEEPSLLSDLGLNPEFNTLKLIGNGSALYLLVSFKRIYNSRLYSLLAKHDELV